MPNRMQNRLVAEGVAEGLAHLLHRLVPVGEEVHHVREGQVAACPVAAFPAAAYPVVPRWVVADPEDARLEEAACPPVSCLGVKCLAAAFLGHEEPQAAASLMGENAAVALLDSMGLAETGAPVPCSEAPWYVEVLHFVMVAVVACPGKAGARLAVQLVESVFVLVYSVAAPQEAPCQEVAHVVAVLVA
mmetsp:Transcript_42993/g.71440  ORF Transcript_42993/g.71440 Transcript_42993/m.71440 type:complete len:189 (+) Transcript_42993:144-710(+)